MELNYLLISEWQTMGSYILHQKNLMEFMLVMDSTLTTLIQPIALILTKKFYLQTLYLALII